MKTARRQSNAAAAARVTKLARAKHSHATETAKARGRSRTLWCFDPWASYGDASFQNMVVQCFETKEEAIAAGAHEKDDPNDWPGSVFPWDVPQWILDVGPWEKLFPLIQAMLFGTGDCARTSPGCEWLDDDEPFVAAEHYIATWRVFPGWVYTEQRIFGSDEAEPEVSPFDDGNENE
jgi:hypothetical protein